MKQLIFLFFLIGLQSNLSAQSDTVLIVRSNTLSGNEPSVDTFLFDSPMLGQVLIGTCILPNTHGQVISWGKGVYFDKVTKTDCMDHGDKVYSEETRINDFTINDTSLIVDMTFIDNCCYEFLCDAEMGDDGILHLKYTGYGSFCGCICCFGVQYHFLLDKSAEDYNLKGIMLEDNPKTLRKIE
ncbi:MAG: hypothetical protein A3D31_05695 [Candidatus Fluviicola riflensis]|nr:MAG: hypothetical protein CHH17_09320 [Candidatus Fluviicola riflensis]OGS79462.1 MAG: hypothetical protein A3D31_05695 [Candidatus Fluviicola riflensis]OGS86893.1 MAG: hypothetical protein A2724_05155 [Fluviicola sp. RIFCSPHIGHO2_01_FULL_43_53]OGS89684.1 MAG: hypothetical protein A3E30_01900 [Fluviicola sp. RIFCSPHIGHO2_12_FULL_43_24]